MRSTIGALGRAWIIVSWVNSSADAADAVAAADAADVVAAVDFVGLFDVDAVGELGDPVIGAKVPPAWASARRSRSGGPARPPANRARSLSSAPLRPAHSSGLIQPASGTTQ